MKKALFWEKQKGLVNCRLCYRNCKITESSFGFCGARKSDNGILYSVNYGQVCALNLDPIEKKPFYHFHPGASALSVASPGCNFRCLHCQNYEISQPSVVPCESVSPKQVVDEALREKAPIVAYTYTEPTIFYEYARDIGVEVRKRGLLNVFVTNGYMQKEPVNDAAKTFLDAVRIDLKGEEEHYKKVCGNVKLDHVFDCITDYYKAMHVEIITLVIPGDNDNKAFVDRMACFLSGLKKGDDIPWHFIGFHPDYKMMRTPATPVRTLEKMHGWATNAGMNYVYTGNVKSEFNNTYCPNCGALLIVREGYSVVSNSIERGKCPKCRAKIPVLS